MAKILPIVDEMLSIIINICFLIKIFQFCTRIDISFHFLCVICTSISFVYLCVIEKYKICVLPKFEKKMCTSHTKGRKNANHYIFQNFKLHICATRIVFSVKMSNNLVFTTITVYIFVVANQIYIRSIPLSLCIITQ